MIRLILLCALIYTVPTWSQWLIDTTTQTIIVLQDTREKASAIRGTLAAQ